ncbi:MAG: outer membrane beta-barrel family protein, partial [Bacteroidota bacterium]
YIIQDANNDFAVSDFINNEWVLDEGFTNVFNFNQKVLGAYGTGAYEGEKWGVKVGLRLENTDLNTLLETNNTANSQNYTNLFPSLHTSYKINDQFSLQAGYSKRIERPSLWSLNPFFNIRNNFNIRLGNPDLGPEFTDSYEMTGIYILDKISFNFGVYHRYTTGVVERITTSEDNVNISRPINLGTNASTGLEINAKYNPAKWLRFNGDFNYRYFSRLGELEGQSFDFAADQWSTRLTAKFKLPAQIDLEVMGNYRSDVQTVQGERSGFAFADLGARKKINKGKAVISLSVRDLFASRIFETEVLQEDFYAYSYGLRGRFIILGFSYGFGKGEAMQYGGGRRR